MDLLETITYEGKTASQLMEETSTPKVSLYRQLNKLVEDKQIIKDDKIYKRLRETPSIGVLFDKLTMYHQQRLMDWKYRRKPREAQQDECLVWLIDGDAIKGKIEEYNEQKLEESIIQAYDLFQKSLQTKI